VRVFSIRSIDSETVSSIGFFTDGEIEYSMSMKFPERHLAARFAGKEAVAKAFGHRE